MPLSLQFFVFLLIKSFYEKIGNLKRDWSQMNDISADGQGMFFKIEYQLATFVRMEELI